MPRHEIGRQVFIALLVAIAAATIVALVALGAKDVVIYGIDAFTSAELATEGLTP